MHALGRLDLRWPALTGGIVYVVAVTLIGTQADTDPVGSHYAAFNRVLSAALVVLTASALAMRPRYAASSLPRLRAFTALAVGLAVMALGSALEFWGSLAAGEPTEAMAERASGAHAFAGSAIGFGIFLAGEICTLVALLVVAVAVRRVDRTLAAAAAGAALANFAAGWLWAVSALAAAIPGVLFALAWLTLAARLARASRPAAAYASPAPTLAPGL